MLLDLTPGAAPAFIAGSYFTRFSDRALDLIVSSGIDLRHRLYDMSPAALWQGETASDASDETITAGLWQPSFQGSRDVDFIALLGHNLASFDIKLSNNNGVTYPTSYATAGEVLPQTIKTVASPVAADKFKIIAHATQTADQYKQIGAIVVGGAQIQPALGMSLYKPRPLRMKDRSAKMADNSTRRSFVYRSDASLHFNDFSIGFSALSDSDADAIEAVLINPTPFIFYPQPGDRPGKMYLGQAVPGTYTRDYFSGVLAHGWAITFDFEEAGGA